MFKIQKINDSIKIGSLDLVVFGEKQKLIQKREIEKKGTLFLLDQLFENRTIQLLYTERNKPYLKGETGHISISHSHDKLVVISNTKESTGIDIELIRDKVKNIQNKFLNEEELNFAKNETETLIKLWAAKESIYKAYGLKGLDFKKHIIIEKFNETSDIFYGKTNLPDHKKKYALTSQKVENYILVYILNEV